MNPTSQWTAFEARLEAAGQYDNPFLDKHVTVRFAAPSGRTVVRDAFWDGGDTWRVRFSPDETGTWRWASDCSDPNDPGLHDCRGHFDCAAYTGENRVFRHGALRLSDDRHHLAHADGTPFFWLADTAWNGVLRAGDQDWQTYLQRRREQGFTAIQFVCTQWRALEADAHGQTGFTYDQPIRLNPAFFQRLDAKVAAINDHGLIAVPVILWANQKTDPGQMLTEADAERIARYIVARWGAHQAVWMLGGDSTYRADRADRWKHIGRSLFEGRKDRLVTMHPHGQASFAEEFCDEAWFDFNTYQSGHGSSHRELSWLLVGPYASDWRRLPVRPSINVEPNYEMHPDYHTQQFFSNFHVRRASYWSLLLAPPAGITYGNNPIWCWADKPEPHPGHPSIDRYGLCPPWHAGVETPGIESMAILRKFFECFHWWRLRPCPELLCRQPGFEDPIRFIAAARTDDRRLAILYSPGMADIEINPAALLPAPPARARWFHPRTARWLDAPSLGNERIVYSTPDREDWVLMLSVGGQ